MSLSKSALIQGKTPPSTFALMPISPPGKKPYSAVTRANDVNAPYFHKAAIIKILFLSLLQIFGWYHIDALMK